MSKDLEIGTYVDGDEHHLLVYEKPLKKETAQKGNPYQQQSGKDGGQFTTKEGVGAPAAPKPPKATTKPAPTTSQPEDLEKEKNYQANLMMKLAQIGTIITDRYGNRYYKVSNTSMETVFEKPDNGYISEVWREFPTEENGDLNRLEVIDRMGLDDIITSLQGTATPEFLAEQGPQYVIEPLRDILQKQYELLSDGLPGMETVAQSAVENGGLFNGMGDVTREARIKAKEEVQQRIADKMRMMSGELFGDVPDEAFGKMVSQAVDYWAKSSGDSLMPSVQVQTVAAEVFKLGDARLDHLLAQRDEDGNILPRDPKNPAGYEQEVRENLRAKIVEPEKEVPSEVAAMLGTMPPQKKYKASWGEFLKTFVKAQYEETQEELKERGITEVVLFRGVNYNTKKFANYVDGESEIVMQPLSSFSAAFNTAIDFSGLRGEARVFAVKVPASEVFSTARTGAGCLSELEFIVLGGKKKAFTYKVDDGDLSETTSIAKRQAWARFLKEAGWNR